MCPMGCLKCEPNDLTYDECETDNHWELDETGGWSYLVADFCHLWMPGCLECSEKATCTACDMNKQLCRSR